MLLLSTGAAARPDYVLVPEGRYTVGRAGAHRNSLRSVQLRAFRIATTETTNAQFEQFVQATGFVSDAERNGFGMTFREGMKDWRWDATPGATWRHPFGPDQPGIEGRPDHPVTQISFNDALAYCRWAGCRLPSVEEWEVAARGGRTLAGRTPRYPWGDSWTSGRANTWQGPSHASNSMEDGFLYTAPVASFAPNNWGLYDVVGNVFEYCTDRSEVGTDGRMRRAVGRGGSWWCSKGTCNFFNLLDIGRMDRRGTLPNQGFRVVREVSAGR